MSIRLSSLVRQTRGLMGTGQKYLLDILADHANEAGECWPSVETLHLTIERSRSVTFEYLDWLETNGFITRHKTASGRNWYQVHEEPLRQMQLNSAPPRRVQKLDPSRNRTSPESGKTGLETGLPPSRNRTSIKQPPSNHQEPPPCARELADDVEGDPGRGDQFTALSDHDRRLIEPYLDQLPARIKLQVFADFVRHRAVMRRQLSISAWKHLVPQLLVLRAAGADLTKSLIQTMAKSLSDPIDPRETRKQGPPVARADDDLSHVTYAPGTQTDDLPEHLRI